MFIESQIIEENKFYEDLKEKTLFYKDPRIKFVGTVYDIELLKKIRENAYGYIHGHEVGGTNPSLLEALATTDLNLLLDVGFNKEENIISYSCMIFSQLYDVFILSFALIEYSFICSSVILSNSFNNLDKFPSQQTLEDIEIILVDDGSNNETKNICDEYGE